MAKNTNHLLCLFFVSTLLLFTGVGDALAADGNTGSSLNIRGQLDSYIDDLDPIFQEPVTWIVENFFLLVVIIIIGLIWYHGADEANSKKSGSVAGQASAQRQQEHVAKKFGWSIVYSILILFAAAKYLL